MSSETSKIYLQHLLAIALSQLKMTSQLDRVDINFPDPKFGDYSTNVALILSKRWGLPAKDIAEKIADIVKHYDTERVFGDVRPVNGFLNFTLSNNYLLKILSAILKQKDKFGSSNLGKNEKVLVEYFQPNIAKPLHLGHLGTAIIGDCIFKVLSFAGFNTESDTHLGDWGTQFGLLLFAFKQYGDLDIIKQNPIEELNKLYIKINAEAETNPDVREQGKAEFVKLEQGDKENRKLWQQFREWSWQEFGVVYQELGIRKADHDWPESFYEDKMPAVIEELKSKQLLQESQGAQIVDLSGYKLGTAVVVKSDGGTTYLLRDLATFIYRKRQGFVKQFYVVDVRQSHTLAQTFKIVELMGYLEKSDEAVHVAYGILTLPEGSMSTRKGSIISAKNFIGSLQKRALEIIEEKNPELKNKEAVAKVVAAGAIKYFNLSRNIKSDIVFDPKKAISFEGNTGPYLQYTHARIHGILRKNQEPKTENQTNSKSPIQTLQPHELSVLRKLNQFPEIVEQVAQDCQPNTLSNYLFELSQTFNAFYQEVPVLQEADEAKKHFRLNLVSGTAQIIKNGLNLLGIEAPEEM